MTGIEMIVAALVAGGSAGVTGAASAAVTDAYTGLRDALRHRFVGRAEAEQVIDAGIADADALSAQLGPDLVASGADQDEVVLAAASHLLAVLRSTDTQTGHSAAVNNIHVGTSYGVAAGTINSPVSINYGRAPDPPPRPGAE
jgi:hypothetical protein